MAFNVRPDDVFPIVLPDGTIGEMTGREFIALGNKDAQLEALKNIQTARAQTGTGFGAGGDPSAPGNTNTTGRKPFEFRANTLTGDASTLLGLTGLIGSQDPVQQALGQRAVQTLGRVNPEALLPLVNDIRAQENALRFRQDQARGLAGEARGLGLESRGGQQQTIEALRALSQQGAPSVVDAQTRVARDRLRSSVASQLASQRGGFNPAAQRQAFRALSQGQVELGSRAAAAKAEEERANREFQRQALTGVQGAQTQLRQQDILQRQQDLAELGQEGRLSAQQAGLIGQRAGLLTGINQQRGAFANQVLGRGDRARQEAMQAAGLIAGVPIQAPGPGGIEQALGLAGAGAATGFAVGGPVGAGIGAAGALVPSIFKAIS